MLEDILFVMIFMDLEKQEEKYLAFLQPTVF